MKKHILRSAMTFAAGAISMAAVAYLIPQKSAQAPVVSENDKFSMITVPILETGNIDGVFVLNHLTGVLAGGVLNEQTSTFTHRYVHNVAADFQSAAKSPKYAIVTGPVNLRGSGNAQPAYGVIYIAELSSGAVIAYAIPRPSNQNARQELPLARLDFFQFAEAVGGR
jgi:hypothetical protein